MLTRASRAVLLSSFFRAAILCTCTKTSGLLTPLAKSGSSLRLPSS